MTAERTETGLEVEAALGEVLAHVRGETALPCRIVDDPAAELWRDNLDEIRAAIRMRLCAVERHHPPAGANPARLTVVPAGSNRSG